MYKLILVGISLFLLYILIKRSKGGKKVGCFLMLIVACVWIATLLAISFEAITLEVKEYRERREIMTTTISTHS